MHIMQELPTNKPNFLFKNTQDFIQTTHIGPQEPIVFINNINLHLNCLDSVKDDFKWSHHSHIMLFFSHMMVYAYRTSEIFFAKKPLQFFFQENHYFKDELTRPIINTNLFYNSQKCSMLKIIEFYSFMHSTFYS